MSSATIDEEFAATAQAPRRTNVTGSSGEFEHVANERGVGLATEPDTHIPGEQPIPAPREYQNTTETTPNNGQPWTAANDPWSGYPNNASSTAAGLGTGWNSSGGEATSSTLSPEVMLANMQQMQSQMQPKAQTQRQLQPRTQSRPQTSTTTQTQVQAERKTQTEM